MYSPTIKKVKTFNLAREGKHAEYEDLLNDPRVVHIKKENVTISKKTDYPIITVWYEEYK